MRWPSRFFFAAMFILPGCFQMPSGEDVEAVRAAALEEGKAAGLAEGHAQGVEEGKASTLAQCQEVDVASLRDRSKVQALLDLNLPCIKLVGEIGSVAQAKIQKSSLTADTKALKRKRKELEDAGGKFVSVLIELNKKESGSIEKNALDALLAKAQYYGYSRVAEVTVVNECGPRDCEATAEGVAVH